MPSKPVAVLMVILVVAAVWGTSQVDWTRDVPFAPENVPLQPGVLKVPQVPDMPEPGEGPRINAPDVPGPRPIAEPEPAPEPKPALEPVKPPVEVGLGLPQIQSKHATGIPSEGVVKIVIEKTGRMLAGGTDLGSYEMLTKRMEFEGGDTVAILAHRETPWKHVFWAIEAAKDGGATKVGFAFKRGRTDSMLVMPLPTREPALPEGMEEYPLYLGSDRSGAYTYFVANARVKDAAAIAKFAGDNNGDFAEMFGGDYARDAAATPWIFICDSGIPAGKAIEVIAAVRDEAIYSIQLRREFGARPRRRQK